MRSIVYLSVFLSNCTFLTLLVQRVFGLSSQNIHKNEEKNFEKKVFKQFPYYFFVVVFFQFAGFSDVLFWYFLDSGLGTCPKSKKFLCEGKFWKIYLLYSCNLRALDNFGVHIFSTESLEHTENNKSLLWRKILFWKHSIFESVWPWHSFLTFFFQFACFKCIWCWHFLYWRSETWTKWQKFWRKKKFLENWKDDFSEKASSFFLFFEFAGF